MKRTFECQVYLTEYGGVDPAQIYHEEQDTENQRRIVNGLAFHMPWRKNNEGPDGWTHIGTATMTIDFVNPTEIVVAKVQSLRKQKNKVLADAQRAANEIEENIQKLLAISYEPQS